MRRRATERMTEWYERNLRGKGERITGMRAKKNTPFSPVSKPVPRAGVEDECVTYLQDVGCDARVLEL